MSNTIVVCTDGMSHCASCNYSMHNAPGLTASERELFEKELINNTKEFQEYLEVTLNAYNRLYGTPVSGIYVVATVSPSGSGAAAVFKVEKGEYAITSL